MRARGLTDSRGRPRRWLRLDWEDAAEELGLELPGGWSEAGGLSWICAIRMASQWAEGTLRDEVSAQMDMEL